MNTSSHQANILVVGAGFAGSVCARELADAGYKVQVIDRRSHMGGNAWDTYDEKGFLIHPYGPHIFHTNSRQVMAWLSRFTEWRFYEHKVLADVKGEYFPIPINRTTLNQVFKKNLTEAEVPEFLESIRQPRSPIKSSEDVVLNSVGPQLCDMFFRGYTQKQWGLDLSELSAGVAARIPVRTNDDDRYFADDYQFMPAKGYGAMFEKMLNHPNIELSLGQNFEPAQIDAAIRHTIYTGPIDAFFNYKFGKLPYRSLRFEHFHESNVAESENAQVAPVVNYPMAHAYTRITEFKQLTGQTKAGSSLVKEFPQSEGDPYYPIPRPENDALFQRYSEAAEALKDVSFVGRLAQYRYYNMDQVVAAALKKASNIKELLQAP